MNMKTQYFKLLLPTVIREGKREMRERKTLNVLYIDNEVMMAWHIVVITKA
jgi:hypothetical protein